MEVCWCTLGNTERCKHCPSNYGYYENSFPNNYIYGPPPRFLDWQRGKFTYKDSGESIESLMHRIVGEVPTEVKRESR
jgi:hypothetical protein